MPATISQNAMEARRMWAGAAFVLFHTIDIGETRASTRHLQGLETLL